MKKSTINIIEELFIQYPVLLSCNDSIFNAVKMLITCFAEGNKLLTYGNGGSAADAQHIVGELMKAFVLPRKLTEDAQLRVQEMFPLSANYLNENLQRALPAISLVGETALMTAYSNDMVPDLVFAQQVYGYGRKGDILLAISTSGNSANVLYACQVAKVLGMKVIAMTGQKGGKLRGLCDIIIDVPSDINFKIQEYHLPVYHVLCLAVENEFFEE